MAGAFPNTGTPPQPLATGRAMKIERSDFVFLSKDAIKSRIIFFGNIGGPVTTAAVQIQSAV
jgi:hypothetical protein